jgi:hypothetical protein
MFTALNQNVLLIGAFIMVKRLRVIKILIRIYETGLFLKMHKVSSN